MRFGFAKRAARIIIPPLQLSANQMRLPNALRFSLRPGDDFLRALDTLVPLNPGAAAALSAAYAEYGSFVPDEELLERRVRRMLPIR